MKVFLVIFFLVNGKPTILDGWHPLELPSMERCMEARALAVQQLDFIAPYPFRVTCERLNEA